MRLLPQTDQLPYALYTAEQVRALDRQAIERFAIPGKILMHRAGKAAFDLLRKCWPQAQDIVVLAGTGNNAGDGFVLATLAKRAGMQVQVLQLGGRESLKGDALFYAEQWQGMHGDWQDFTGLPKQCDVIVDALLGTGLQRDVKGIWKSAIEAANVHSAPVLAIDIPSGLHSDTGQALGTAIHAQATISFIGLKQGMFTADGVDCCGDITFDGLEVPAAVYASQLLSVRRMDWAKQSKLGQRKRTAHKGHFGHVLVIGGDHGYGGAVRLAAEAAARCGAGLVSVSTRAVHVPGLLAACPELMVHAVDDYHALEPLLQKASVVVLGPGLGTSAWGRGIFAVAMQSRRPMVIDADALNLLAEQPALRDNWVLTPHPGEAARLLNLCTAEIGADRFAVVRQLQQRYSGVAVLKGAGSLIATGGQGPLVLCSQGNPGMATGGMGDVLSGVIAGLLAQGLDSAEAAEMGVCLHAAAADVAAGALGERGLLASDLMPYIQQLNNE
jgi:hydroxyethylthiazole kinase-like uncharacterized protein yjeF